MARKEQISRPTREIAVASLRSAVGSVQQLVRKVVSDDGVTLLDGSDNLCDRISSHY